MRKKRRDEDQMTGQVVCTALLGVNAVQDIRRREIVFVPTVAAGVAGVLWNYFAGSSGAVYFFCAMIPGMVLLTAAWLTGGQIGRGDGILILACGAWCGFPDSFYISCMGLFLALIGAALLLAKRHVQFCMSRVRRCSGGRRAGERAPASSLRLPLAPYLFAAYIILLIVRR